MIVFALNDYNYLFEKIMLSVRRFKMRQKVLGLVGIGMGILLVTISGCATNRVSLADEGLVSVETVPSKKVEILWTDVYEDGNDVVVYGAVQQHTYSGATINVHVDITVLSNDGVKLQERTTADISVPRRRHGKGVDWKRFELRFPGTFPEDATVKMVVHAGPHNKDKTS